MTDYRIGRLFPAGGPVSSELMIGRGADVEELHRRVAEGIHTMLTGERRIGKTTVCNAVCERSREDGLAAVQIEVPEGVDGTALLQLVVDRFSRISLASATRRLFKSVRPFIEEVMREHGVPLDLSELDAPQAGPAVEAILSLPARLADEIGRPVVFYLDELQRAVDYDDGDRILHSLVDLYSGNTDVVLLVDGSNERSLDGLMDGPVRFGKLVDRLALEPAIPTRAWREALPERFEKAKLSLDGEALEALLAFGRGRPYATMTASRYAALNARKLGTSTVGKFEITEGIAEAGRHLAEDE